MDKYFKDEVDNQDSSELTLYVGRQRFYSRYIIGHNVAGTLGETTFGGDFYGAIILHGDDKICNFGTHQSIMSIIMDASYFESLET